jgi:transposase
LEACKLVTEHGYSLRDAAGRLGTTVWSIRSWIKKFRTEGALAPEEQTAGTVEELKQLRKENRQLRLENEILKKAAAYFAKDQL